jgi:ketosteroid isomerase-like protein
MIWLSEDPTPSVRRSGRADAGTAWITSESRATGTYKDKAVDRLMTETMVLRNTTDGWRIAHIHWSSRPST